ncbi:MAG: hypothetical protein H6Q48_3112, partial [Deltaproteobacteria bacterium]|nr:hypothetical protein [Deltaproteobacteria bacterium]
MGKTGHKNILDTSFSLMLYGAMDGTVGVLTPVVGFLRWKAHSCRWRAALFLPWVLISLLFLSFFSGKLWGASDTVLEARLISSTLKIFPDFAVNAEPMQPFLITAVRNEYAPFQVAIRAKKPLKGVAVAMENPAKETVTMSHSVNRTLLVETVPVERPSIPLKRGAGVTFPQSWPDPLPPFETIQLDAAGRTRAVWFDLFIPADTRPGIYKGNIVVSATGIAPVKLPFQVEVHDITIPTAPSLRTAFGNASLRTCLEKRQAAPPGESAPFNKLVEEYYWFLVEHRLSPYYIPADIFSSEAHKFLDDPRVTSFVVPVSGGIGNKGEIWDDAKMKSLSDRLEKTGWIGKGFVYLIDEPSQEAFPDVIKIGKRVHTINPRLKYLM